MLILAWGPLLSIIAWHPKSTEKAAFSLGRGEQPGYTCWPPEGCVDEYLRHCFTILQCEPDPSSLLCICESLKLPPVEGPQFNYLIISCSYETNSIFPEGFYSDFASALTWELFLLSWVWIFFNRMATGGRKSYFILIHLMILLVTIVHWILLIVIFKKVLWELVLFQRLLDRWVTGNQIYFLTATVLLKPRWFSASSQRSIQVLWIIVEKGNGIIGITYHLHNSSNILGRKKYWFRVNRICVIRKIFISLS